MTNAMHFVMKDAYKKLRDLTPEQESELAERLVKCSFLLRRLEDALEYSISELEKRLHQMDCSEIVNDMAFRLGQMIVAGVTYEDIEIEATKVYWMQSMTSIESFLVYFVISCMVDLKKTSRIRRDSKDYDEITYVSELMLQKFPRFPHRIVERLWNAEKKEAKIYREEFVGEYFPKASDYEVDFCVYEELAHMRELQKKLDELYGDKYDDLCFLCEPKELNIIKTLGKKYVCRMFELNREYEKYAMLRKMLAAKNEIIKDIDVIRFWQGLSKYIKDREQYST